MDWGTSRAPPRSRSQKAPGCAVPHASPTEPWCRKVTDSGSRKSPNSKSKTPSAGEAGRPDPVPAPEASGLQAPALHACPGGPAGTRPVLECGLHLGAPASEPGCQDRGDAAGRAAVLCPADALWMVTDLPLGAGAGAGCGLRPSEACCLGSALSCWPARPERQGSGTRVSPLLREDAQGRLGRHRGATLSEVGGTPCH